MRCYIEVTKYLRYCNRKQAAAQDVIIRPWILAHRRAFAVGTGEIAAVLVIVVAQHEDARAFNERYEFQRFPDNELRLFLPMQTIGQLLAEGDG